MRRIVHPGRDMIEETPRITIADLRAWGFIPGPGEERTGIVTLSRDGEETGRLQATARIDGLGSFIRFDYLLGEERTPVAHEHGLEPFPCHLGGHRLYFRCKYCARRVTALYLSGGYYACRHCHRLAYMVSQEHGTLSEMIDRAHHLRARAKRLREYRHPRKANRLLARAGDLEVRSNGVLAAWLGRKGRL
jgi:hypothetical protein